MINSLALFYELKLINYLCQETIKLINDKPIKTVKDLKSITEVNSIDFCNGEKYFISTEDKEDNGDDLPIIKIESEERVGTKVFLIFKRA